MLKAKLLNPKSLVMADQLAVSGGSFLSQVFLARGLGLEGYGYFSFLVLAQLFLLSLQQAGLTGIACVVFPSLKNENKQRYINGLFGVQALFLAGVMLLCAGYYFLFKSTYTPLDALAAALNILFFLLLDFIRRLLIVADKLLPSFFSSSVNFGLQLGLLLVLQLTGNFTFSAALWVCAITYVPSLIAGLVWLRPNLFSFLEMKEAMQLGRTQSGWMLLSAALQWLGGNFYIVAAGWWLGAATLGVLRLAQYLFGLLNILMQAVENYALPRAASLTAPHEIVLYARAMFKKLATFTFPALFLMALVTKPLLQWLGKDASTLDPMIVYGFALLYVFITAGYPIRITLRALQLNRAYFQGYLITTIFSLCTAYFFLSKWGAGGVMMGLLFSQVLLLLYWTYTIKLKTAATWKSFI